MLATPPNTSILALLIAASIGFFAGLSNRPPSAAAACSPIRLTNLVEENAPGTGTWGGECRCPDGSVYLVADNNDLCSTLACVGGTYSQCNKEIGPWSHRRVTSLHM